MSLSGRTSNIISKRKEKAKKNEEKINEQAKNFIEKNPETVESHKKYKRDALAKARDAVDYNNPDVIAKQRANMAKARAAIKPGTLVKNMKIAQSHISDYSANTAKARAARSGTNKEIMENARNTNIWIIQKKIKN
jgi:hypothetical protein